MLDLEKYLENPGEHVLSVQGKVGKIEVVLAIPETPSTNLWAILGHPHSLQGGTMNNKVVTTSMRAFRELHIPSVRFNFRGVGKTEGHYDAGIGESEDMLMLAEAIQSELSLSQFLFAGFSFGSYVAYRTAIEHPSQLLITIAPPVHHYDYTLGEPAPWEVILGETDEVVPVAVIEQFLDTRPYIHSTRFAETGHFFHGKLLQLKDTIKSLVVKHGICT